jgi:hypothetical protein
VNRALEQQVRFAAIATTPSVLCWLVPNLTGRSAVSISSRANDAFGLHCRQETDGSLRRLESCVLHPGRFRRPLRLDDAILEFGFLHSSILESGYAAILELGCRQVNRCTRDQESSAADHHSGKSNAEVAGHRKLRAVKRAG